MTPRRFGNRDEAADAFRRWAKGWFNPEKQIFQIGVVKTEAED